MRDESQWLRLQLADDELATRSRPVAVIVLEDGTELHFFQFIDSDESLVIEDTRYKQSTRVSIHFITSFHRNDDR